MNKKFNDIATLKKSFEGEVFTDETTRLMYATDASAYREVPAFVTYPKTKDDIVNLIHYARRNSLSIIPRTAGTSLAGQVVGNGIIADVSIISFCWISICSVSLKLTRKKNG